MAVNYSDLEDKLELSGIKYLRFQNGKEPRIREFTDEYRDRLVKPI